MTTALTTVTRITRMATAAARYIDTVPAPEPAVVTLYPGGDVVKIQPSLYGKDAVQVLGALLIWSHQLTGITGRWHHLNDGTVLINLTGRGPYGIRFNIYYSLPHADIRRHVALPPGARESVTPDELYRLGLQIRTSQNGDPA